MELSSNKKEQGLLHWTTPALLVVVEESQISGRNIGIPSWPAAICCPETCAGAFFTLAVLSVTHPPPHMPATGQLLLCLQKVRNQLYVHLLAFAAPAIAEMESKAPAFLDVALTPSSKKAHCPHSVPPAPTCTIVCCLHLLWSCSRYLLSLY